MLQLVLVSVAAQSAPQEPVRIELPPTARVAGVEFTLGDIARIEGADSGAVQRVRTLHLGYAPAPGYSRLIEAQALTREARASFPGMELVVTGATSCRVEPQTQQVDSAAIGAAAKTELLGIFRGREVELQMQGRLQDVSVPLGAQPAELRVRLRERSPRPGSWSVPVEVVVDGSIARTIWTSWVAELWLERDVLVRDVARGETLSIGDVERRRIRVRQLETRRAIDPAALRGATARRDLRAGEIVTASDVDREVVIRRGGLVHVQVKKGAITVRGAGIAQEDGRIGDRVRIVMNSTESEVIGVAAGKDRVEIRMN